MQPDPALKVEVAVFVATEVAAAEVMVEGTVATVEATEAAAGVNRHLEK